MDPGSEVERDDDEEEDLNLPKNEKMLRKALPSDPPLSLDRLRLDAHEILLGAPLLLNPPSISVYTTGSSRSPALLPPENLPTANPPPGSLHMVSPTVSSSFGAGESASVPDTGEFLVPGTSVGNSWRQTGHELRRDSHGRIQSE